MVHTVSVAPLLVVVASACVYRDLDAPRTPSSDGDAANGDATGAPPPNLTGLTAAPLSATRIRLSWQSGGGTTAGFRLAYSSDGVAPANCDDAVPESEIYGTTHDVRGLEPGTRYDFRVCAVNANAPPDSSPGVTVFATTPSAPNLPSCDTTVLAGSHTMANIQTVLDDAVAAGDGGDGTIAVCLEDGVVVGAEGGNTIQIPGNDLFILAHDGDEARFDNPSKAIFSAFNRTNIRLHNLFLRPGGHDAIAISLDGTEAPLLSGLRIAIDGGNGAAVIVQWGSTVGDVTGLDIAVEGGDSVGIAVANGSSIASIAETRITTYDSNVALYLDSGDVGIVQSTLITTSGPGAHGIVLRRNSHVDAMSGVTLRRLGASGVESNTHAIVCDSALGAGGDEYFVTSAIHDVTICSTFDIARWTSPFSDTSDGSVFVQPTAHVAFAGGGRGCETFPFDDAGGSSAGADHQITWGGTCSPTATPTTDVDVSSSIDFASFQGILNGAWAAGDLDGDGLITVRIADGVIIRNSNTLAQGRIVIPGSNFYIYAQPGDTAMLLNERTNGTGADDHGVVYSVGMHNLSLVNLTLRSTGDSGVGLRTDWAFGGDEVSSVVLDRLTVQTDGENADGIHLENTTVQAISNATVTTTGRYATPLVAFCGARINTLEDSTFIGTGADIDGLEIGCGAFVNLMRRVDVETTRDGSPGLLLYKNAVVARIEGPALIRTAGERSHGLVLAGSSSVGAIDALTIARSATATAPAVAVLASPNQGTDNYFDSPNIANVTVCNESGALEWEAGGGFLLADGDYGGPWTPPATHVPHLPGPVFGSQTFPFEDPAMSAQSIQFGGACP